MSVSVKYKNFLQGISVLPKSTSESTLLGEIEVLNTTNKLYFYNSVTYGSDAIVQENVPATLSNKTLTAPVINNATANTITGIAGGDLSLQSSVGNKVVVEAISFDSSTISASTDININTTGTAKTYFQVTGTNVVRIDADGIAFLNQNDAKFYDATTNYVNIQASNPTASYPITLPAAAPTANTALVYDGTAYKWGAAGGADSAGANDDILATAFRARILDSFDDAPSAPPTGASTINSLTTTATHVPANQLYAIQYDGTQTLSGGGTAYSLGASPSFTLAAGDVLVAGGEVRKITVLGTPNAWVNFTIESAFVGSPSGPCVVSQTVSSKELYGSVFDGDSISDAFSNASFSEYLIDYQDSTTAIYQTGTSPLVAYSVSQDASTWSNPVNRPQYQTDQIQSGAFASPGTALYVRLFANANTLASSGTINLLEYRAYMQKSPTVASGSVNQAYTRLAFPSVGTPKGCTVLNPASYGGKSAIQLDWDYSLGVNPTLAYGALDVYINGQIIPRFIDSVTTNGAYYTESPNRVIVLDSNYSTSPYAIQIIQRQPMGNFTSSTGSSSSAVGSGLKNYLTTYKGNAGNGDFETGDTTGWDRFNTTLTGVIPTGSISSGAGSITTFQATSTTPLAATYSLSVGGSISAGQGFISDAFTIDLEDQAKVLTFSFAYQAVSGTMNFSGTSSNTWAVYLHDGTNWIQPAGVYNLVQSSGAGLATGTFQTTSTATAYRIAVICINTTGAVSMKFDDFFVGPQISVTAPAMSDWVSYVPNIAGFTSFTSSDFQYRRVGSNIEVRGRFVPSSAGSGSQLRIHLPFNLTSSIPSLQMVGSFQSGDLGAIAQGVGVTCSVLAEPSLNYLTFSTRNNSQTGLAQLNGVSVIVGGVTYSLFASVPITGWSSNTVASADTDTRVVATAYSGATTTLTTGGTTVTFPTRIVDTHAAYNSGTGVVTIQVSGLYKLSVFLKTAVTAGTGSFGINVTQTGSVSQTVEIGRTAKPSTSTAKGVVGSRLFSCNAGDTLTIIGFDADANSLVSESNFALERLSGPAVVQASETVAASYWASANGTSTTTSPINFDTKEYDTHNAVTASPPGSGAWRYTAPVSGTYLVSLYSNQNAGTSAYYFIYKNSTSAAYKTIAYCPSTVGLVTASTSLKLNAGDYIGIYTNVSTAYQGNASLASNLNSHISITRTGN